VPTLNCRKDDGFRVIPGHVIHQNIQSLLAPLGQFAELVEGAIFDDDKVQSGKELTPKARLMQYVVDGMMGVFIEFRTIERVVRSDTGEFAEFIRRAAKPTLREFHQNYSEDPKKPKMFEDQIKHAVASAKRYKIVPGEISDSAQKTP